MSDFTGSQQDANAQDIVREKTSVREGALEKKRSISGVIRQIKAAPILCLMMGIIFIWAFIFHYIPIYGITIAFRKFRLLGGYFSGEWVGFRYFQQFFKDPYAFRIIKNTVVLGFYSLLFGFPAPILFCVAAE